MIETPQIVGTPSQPVAALHISTPRSEMRHVMGPGIREAMAAAQAQGLGPTGPWFAHHREITAERFDFDICVPVSASVDAVGRVRPWTRPALDVVRTVYQGPYEGLGDAWQAFDDWIAATGVQASSDVYERYLVGPESTPDATQYRTELSRPLAGARTPTQETTVITSPANPTNIARSSDRELVITRTFDAPARLVFEAWTTAALFKQWWVPKSSGADLLSCEMDVRVGGGYRLEFRHPKGPEPMAFFGKYLEVMPPRRLVWSNEESPDGAISSIDLTEQDGKTRLVMTEVYPTKEALDVALEGMGEGMPETFDQLAEFLAARGTF